MTTTRETADHAELLAKLANAHIRNLRLAASRDFAVSGYSDGLIVEQDMRGMLLAAAEAFDALLSEIAALRGERDRIAGESIWWKGVIGDASHQPSGEIRSIKHMHPAMVKPIYDAHKGTAVADVIAGLIFSLAITQNREQFLVEYANDRATQAERQRDELWKALEPFATQRVNGEDNSSEIVPNGYSSAEKWRENVLRARQVIANQGADQ